MSNEYDYSGLYNHTSDGQPAQPQSSQPEQGGYPNVGSSGMNTANQYNNEPEAMRDIMMIYGGLRRPILVLFLTDGRLQSDWEIEEYLYRI